MDKVKQQWTVEETGCLLAIWSSDEIQWKLEGASRTKPVFDKIQAEMALAGYERSVEQIIKQTKEAQEGLQGPKARHGSKR